MAINYVNLDKYINIKYIMYLDPKVNPNLGKHILLIYRIIWSLIVLYFYLNHNTLYLFQFIDILNINYYYELSDDNIIDYDLLNTCDEDINNLEILNVNPMNNSFIGGSYNNNPGFGPSGRGPGGGDPVGTELTMENENMRKRKRDSEENNVEPKVREDAIEFKFFKKRKLYHEHKDFRFWKKIPDRNKLR